jgi:peptide deformylase
VVRRILTLPDDAERLRMRSVKVKRFDDEVRQTIQDLKDTFAVEKAYGLSAPQIGVLRRIILFKGVEEDATVTVVVNPKILRADGELKDFDGCLSIPGIYGRTRRAARIVLIGLDENGEPLRLKLQDFTARIAQHEVDHLDGVLFIDRVDDLSDLYVLERGEEGEEPQEVPLPEEERRLVERFRQPLPAYALSW